MQDRRAAEEELEATRVEEAAQPAREGRRRRSSLDNFGLLRDAVGELLPDPSAVARTASFAIAGAVWQLGVNHALNIRRGRFPAPSDYRNWNGHDMTVWPPTNLRRHHGGVATFSWLYMPIILDALEIANFPFARNDGELGHAEANEQGQWRYWTEQYAIEFARREITQEAVISRFDSHLHLRAEQQEYLLAFLPELAQQITFYAWSLIGRTDSD